MTQISESSMGCLRYRRPHLCGIVADVRRYVSRSDVRSGATEALGCPGCPLARRRMCSFGWRAATPGRQPGVRTPVPEGPPPHPRPGRHSQCGELQDAALAAREARERLATHRRAEENAARERAQAAARERHLTSLAGRHGRRGPSSLDPRYRPQLLVLPEPAGCASDQRASVVSAPPPGTCSD